MANKSPVYVRIDEEVKNKAFLYVTKSKLLKRDTKTLSKLVEKSLEYYMNIYLLESHS